ncbi:MAG TPA: UPF0182 family protein [Acidimicrobiales bacterium]|nr:UPF0182 family protein [Acidimicrobiales bacterium]
MRMPPPTPIRGRSRTNRSRIGLVAAVGILFTVLTSLRGVSVFYTEYLWFHEVDLTSVWRGVLGAKVLLALLFTAIFFAAMWLNLFIADRLAPRFRAQGPEDEFVQRYQETVGRHSGKVRALVAFLFALLSGTGVSGQWHNWLLFRNGVDFGIEDSQFGRDVGFFVFKLPFISFLVDWAFVSVVIIAAVTVGAHYLNGGIRLQAAGERVTPRVKAHVSVLLGALALIKAVGYFFQRYELQFSTRGAVHGATYTDVKAQLPAIQLLIIISLAAFVLFVVNIRRQGWVLPLIGVGLWALISVLVGAVYPAFIQKFRVEPAENRRERPYIVRNIAATRQGMGLTDVVTKDFSYDDKLNADDLAKNSATVRNVRLWDPKFVKDTYQKLQEIRSYYRFNDVDIDRYVVNGKMTQTLVSARELNPPELPANSWVNRHLQYTHGFGVILAPANAVTTEGKPDFYVKDVPPVGEPKIAQPRIYYGEKTGGYAIVKSDQAEIDFPRGKGGDQTTTYSGKGGVPLNSFFRRVALALRFGDPNFVLSGLLRSDSRAIYLRDIGERVRAAAPFLRYDADPYPVILKGRVLWVQDAYTTTSRYPSAQRANTERVPDGSGLAGGFNYVRNSVKVVIDAYDGSMVFYLIDDKDPIAKTYAKAFPKLFTPGKAMDDELRAHLRYPEDLFRVQTNMLGRYHITDPLEFYNAGDAWNVAQDPGSGSPAAATQKTTTRVNATTVQERELRQDPTYMLMRLPGEEKESFLILQPMVPGGSDKQRNLTAFVTAKSDPGEYGKIQVFVMPRGRQIDGPSLADARTSAEPSISQAITQLNQQGSSVLLGNMLLLPIEDSLLYVRPLYVTSDRNKLPELKRVIVIYADRAVMRPTLQEALAEIFGDAPATLEEGPDNPDGTPSTPRTADESVATLLERADAAFAAADAALRAGNLSEYEKKVKEGIALVRQARQRGGAKSTTTTTDQAA